MILQKLVIRFKTMNYKAYHFTIHPVNPGTDILIAVLGEDAFESFTTTDTGFTAYIPASALLETDLSNLHFDDFTFTLHIENIAEQNWNANWEASFEPVEVEDLVYIHANFHTPSIQATFNIEITPKMSFGTGHHDTTWQMCKALFSISIKDKVVLDMGCGTGVLAILAKKLGAASTLAIDIDEWSVENTIENCGVNNVPEIEVKKGDANLLPTHAQFDIILANINKNILKQDMKAYYNCLQTNGYLLLSGFFTTDVEELTQHATAIGFILDYTSSKNSWAIIQLKK
jgi:ribosomal protein L11 methyltransferase